MSTVLHDASAGALITAVSPYILYKLVVVSLCLVVHDFFVVAYFLYNFRRLKEWQFNLEFNFNIFGLSFLRVLFLS